MDSAAQLGRLLLSLAFVLGVMWLIARRVKKNPTRVRNTKLIDVVGRHQLTKSSSIAVVRILDQALIVGVTDGHVSVLGEADLEKVAAHVEEAAPAKAQIRLRASRPRKADPAPAVAAAEAAPRPMPASRPTPVNRPAPANHVALADHVALANQAAQANHVAPREQDEPPRKSAFAGSALSPGTWRATMDSIRDLTVRTR